MCGVTPVATEATATSVGSAGVTPVFASCVGVTPILAARPLACINGLIVGQLHQTLVLLKCPSLLAVAPERATASRLTLSEH